MCGICGLIVESKKRTVDWSNVLNKMTAILEHRGPDCKGHYYRDNGDSIVGLGHRRLSIIDLSGSASQPIGNEDDTLIVVFNGEIYNYRELTKELIDAGHRFKSNSDTEVIVHLYEDYKERCLDKLDGMFAFALLDRSRNRLVLARDRIGIKPLFYALKGKNFYFASEIKSLLLIDEISREIDLKALDLYFTYGYIPGARTIFKDIKKLPPASYLTFENQKLNVTPYWSLSYLPKLNDSEHELKEQLISIFEKAVKRHLIGDVPLGAFLSGGIDSSIIVALMHKVGDGRVNTFSLGYTAGEEDELEYARAIADHYNTDHQEFKVKPEMTSILPQLLWHLDEPFFDNSIIPTYYISKLARQKVKVVLSGDGGDELFAGYEWTRRHQYQVAYSAVPKLIRDVFAKPFSKEIRIGDQYGRSWASRTRRFLHDINADVQSGFLRRTAVAFDFRQKLYSEHLRAELNGFDATDFKNNLFESARVSDEREKMLYADAMSYLPDDCLFKVDRMSMAHGLEVRVPFLDRELVEFAAQIPFELKLNGFTSKYILKEAFASFLPRKNLKQRKQGFTLPISSWLRGDLGKTAKRLLLNDGLAKRNLFDTQHIKWMLQEHIKGRQEFGHRLWSLAIFEIWAKLYLDEKITSAPNVTFEEIIN